MGKCNLSLTDMLEKIRYEPADRPSAYGTVIPSENGELVSGSGNLPAVWREKMGTDLMACDGWLDQLFIEAGMEPIASDAGLRLAAGLSMENAFLWGNKNAASLPVEVKLYATDIGCVVRIKDSGIGWDYNDIKPQNLNKGIQTLDWLPGGHYNWEDNGTALNIMVINAEKKNGKGLPPNVHNYIF